MPLLASPAPIASTPNQDSIEFDVPLIGRKITLSLAKIKAVLYGVALGDALGLPVETMTAQQIAALHGKVTKFLNPALNEYYREANCPPGTTSDDLQLTLAIMHTLSAQGGYEINSIINGQAAAMETSSLGWGGSTIYGVQQATQHGARWYEQLSPQKGGLGNGIPMKITGLALLAAIQGISKPEFFRTLKEFAMLTHPTSIGIASGAAHAAALLYCLSVDAQSFNVQEFSDIVCSVAEESVKDYTPLAGLEVAGNTAQELVTQLRRATSVDGLTSQQIISDFKGGCRVVESLPFSYAFFLNSPLDFSAVIETVSAGGDTDSNGAFVGALLGALCGDQHFPQELLRAIHGINDAEKCAQDFWSVFTANCI